ncbi:MAG: DNA-directed RNA polymerase subunit alpha C-terminal domain-containing protein [Planctomycetia bacterium]|nr:DNA-directed RNA polymerase subunit alpha C-terminal domain-containing protein [Planctomycetia bacterium]
MTLSSQDFDLKQMVLYNGSFGPREIDQLIVEINRDLKKFDDLRDAVNELKVKDDEELSPATQVKLGVCQFLLGQYYDSQASLKKGDGGALAQFYFARLHAVNKEYEESIASYNLAQTAGYNGDICSLHRAEVYRNLDRPDLSLNELDRLSGAIEQTADYLYQRGATVAAIGGNLREAIALYERALAVDRTHPGALFGLALENERHGNDEEALELYKRAVAHFPTNVGTLMNLGLLYEDLEMFDQAIVCFQRVLDSFPTNAKANLFLKDARASSEMLYDEDAQRKRDRMSQILSLPVTDFELSVRSRNCLKTMGINTLGDLCRRSEQELLGSKNFGETSLDEIREMLTLKGLKLGMFSTEKHTPEPVEEEELSAEEQSVLARPVSDLNLSVRARKCMNRLNIQTIGELVRRTAEELLECKNFGVTSLKEIREKLVDFNIRLRGE